MNISGTGWNGKWSVSGENTSGPSCGAYSQNIGACLKIALGTIEIGDTYLGSLLNLILLFPRGLPSYVSTVAIGVWPFSNCCFTTRTTKALIDSFTIWLITKWTVLLISKMGSRNQSFPKLGRREVGELKTVDHTNTHATSFAPNNQTDYEEIFGAQPDMTQR